MRRLTKIDFINKSLEKHNGKYDYSKVEYKNNKTKVKIICPIHGVFEQTPNVHLDSSGCLLCGKESFSSKKKLTSFEFIQESKKIHTNKYDYSLVHYLDYKTKVKIICKIHGEFEQTPNSHLNGSGCQKCGGVHKPTSNEIIFNSKLIHGDKYNYSLVNYIDSKTKINIICPKHGQFEQLPINHVNGQGCPICKDSKGEKAIRKYFLNNRVNFIKQKRFTDCKDIRPLPFDFYLPDYNICVEYDGRQHFISVNRWGGINGLLDRQKKDLIKTNYCKINNIKLIRINYNDDIHEQLKQINGN